MNLAVDGSLLAANSDIAKAVSAAFVGASEKCPGTVDFM
jgi:hypothetical protein